MNDICSCGNLKESGKALCRTCSMANKALSKGNLARFYELMSKAKRDFCPSSFDRVGDLLIKKS